MSLLVIRKYPDPVLKQKAEQIKDCFPELKKLAKDMIETMEQSEGVGLAASQIGISKKIIIVQTGKCSKVFLNPKIIKKSRRSEAEEEGCLSVPGVFLKIKRSDKIEIEAENLKFERVRISAEGMLARIFQHEIDHLNGKLIIDKIPIWRKWKLKKTLKINNKL